MRYFSVLAAALLAAATAASAAEESATEPKQIEICFVLDSTGSMGGLIEGAKQKIWSIANEIASAKPAPKVKFGLIGYRDRGDDYVTKCYELTEDLDSIYNNLQGFKAAGGGDGPESVNQALDEAVEKMPWSKSKDVLKVIFLVGDAPPHTDYKDIPSTEEICEKAVRRDLIINTIQCGSMQETVEHWKKIARLSEGEYTAIGQTGDMIVVETPMDARMAELTAKINKTLVPYGSERERLAASEKADSSAAAPVAAQAARAGYMMKAEAGKAVTGSGELISQISEGKVKIEEVDKKKLPKELQSLSSEDLQKKVAALTREREKLQKEMLELSKQRDEFLLEERKRLAEKGKKDAFDDKIRETIEVQGAKKGIKY